MKKNFGKTAAVVAATAVLMAALCSVKAYGAELPAQPVYTMEMAEQDLDTVVDSVRAYNGISELEVTEELSVAADKRAEEIAAAGVLSHVRPDGTAFYTVDEVNAWGENLGSFKYTVVVDGVAAERDGLNTLAVDVVTAWCNSETHLSNILNAEYTTVGYGVAHMQDGSLVVVQLFGF